MGASSVGDSTFSQEKQFNKKISKLFKTNQPT